MDYFRMLFISALIFFATNLHAENNINYIWDKDIGSLPSLQREFVTNVVKSYRKKDLNLWRSLVHPDGVSKPECEELWSNKIKNSTILPQYAVRVKNGKKEGELYFSIRHQEIGQDSKRNFIKFKRVMNHEGKLVIYTNCESNLRHLDKIKAYRNKQKS